MLTPNVSSPDRVIRLIAGIVLIALPFLVQSIGSVVWLLWGLPIVGAVLIVTALISWCPIYAALGLSTKARLPS